jgi:catechol 2,3-dioxygenase-like lactoylglutathione lyase family enzyme
VSDSAQTELDTIHHVAVPVRDVDEAVRWYSSRFRCRVAYQDPTWAMLEFGNTRLALVVPDQHPPHLGFEHPNAEEFGPLTLHRDRTRSIYLQDPSGNSVEIIDAASITPPEVAASG